MGKGLKRKPPGPLGWGLIPVGKSVGELNGRITDPKR